jgi:hypothetical protein
MWSATAFMPDGHRFGSTVMSPWASRVPDHQPPSSQTYWYPAAFRPRLTSESVALLIVLSSSAEPSP